MRKILLIFVLLSCSLSMAASTLAQQADSAYNAEDYNRAIELYKASITNHGVSSDIYYNLGNAYYRAGQLGRAVLSYERALRVDPTNGDARTNLDFVRSRIQDRPEDDTAFISSMHHSLMGSLTANTWAWTAFVVFLLFLGAVALYIFSTSVTLRKTGFFGGLVLLFVFLYFLLVAYDANDYATSHETAVVVVPSTQLSSGPRASKSATDRVVTIHEGTSVEIVDSISTPDDPVSPKWYNVKINNNTKAWMRSSDVERI